jgi:hypothetical protein
MSRTGTVIVVDNAVRDGKILDPDSLNPDVHGMYQRDPIIRGDFIQRTTRKKG